MPDPDRTPAKATASPMPDQKYGKHILPKASVAWFDCVFRVISWQGG
jgi:hypothetical protein